MFHFFRIYVMVSIGSRKRPRARLEARRAWIAGRAVRSGRIAAAHARTRAWRPCERERRSGSQIGFPRKSLNSLDPRKKEAWIPLPPALNLLPKNLDFSSQEFGLSFHWLWKSFHKLGQVLCFT